MPNNSQTTGIQNEIEFVKKLHNKKFNDIDFNLQLFLEDIFPNINENSLIKCYKNNKLQKYDIFIKVDNIVKRVSIKKGAKNSVHTEPISEFIHFLIENRMPKELVINFLKYHYADGTTNGKGRKRQTIAEYKEHHQNEIDEINKFINQKEILIKAIDRFIIKGRNFKEKIDIVLYGTPKDFLWIKSEDIYDIMLTKKDEYSSAIHFSHLIYQPLNRCLNYNPKYEKCRYISQLKWFSINDDIIENMNNKL